MELSALLKNSTADRNDRNHICERRYSPGKMRKPPFLCPFHKRKKYFSFHLPEKEKYFYCVLKSVILCYTISVSQHLAYRGRILNPGSADQFSGFGSLIFLNSGLIELGGNLLFTSHDHQFVNSIANRMIELTNNGIIDSP